MLGHIFFGWLGSLIFAACAIPQVVKTWRSKSTNDLSTIFLLMWFLGEVFVLFYIVVDDIVIQTLHAPLYINYIFNILLVSYLLYAKIVYG